MELAEEEDPGAALVAESRQALTGLPGGRSLFAVPTSRGGVCSIVTTPGSSFSCGGGSDLPSIVYWNPAMEKPYLAAILPNEIVAIMVQARGQSSRVPVHKNAFYFQLADEVPLGAIRLIAEYRDGSEQRVG
jgi:hypothetical protein